MHQHQEVVKNFLVEYVVKTRREKQMKKSAMSLWLQVDPRSYLDVEKGRYGLSAAALLCFQCHLTDDEIVEMIHQFRGVIKLERWVS